MDKTRWKKISHMIDVALLMSPEERVSFIQEKCGSDRQLFDSVYSLLHTIETSGDDKDDLEAHLLRNESLLDEAFQEKPDQQDPFLKGKQIGNWEPVQLLGRGGMGSVYKAIRKSGGIEHIGALKILHHNLNTPENVRRFHQEQQILAGLHHPSITGLIEGGVSDDGIPYLVMEYAEGTSILKYCNENHLTIDERLELFRIVCRAVQFAHNKLIVHRDLKPENILVTSNGNVKILDFGIAKLLDPDLYHLSPLETRDGIRMITLGYSAPEQIAGEPVSMSSDIYSLGVLLYELLAGVHPFDIEEKRYKAIVQSILHEDAPAPSQKLLRIKDVQIQKSHAGARSTDFNRLVKQLKGDLDAIIKKSLRNEPENRYPSASHLMEDLDRYLKQYPVQARKGTFRYRINKFGKRNKSVLIATAISLSVITGLAGIYIQQITEQRNIAHLEAEKANRIKEFATMLFDSNNPFYEGYLDGEVTAKQLLEAGILNIDTELIREPELYSEMHTVIGRALIGLGEYERAKESIDKSLETALALYGENHPAVAENMVLLGRLNGLLGNTELALEWIQQAHDINEALENEHSTALANNYADFGQIYAYAQNYGKAAEYYQTALDIFKEIGMEESSDAALTRSNLAGVQIRLGLLDQAKNNELSAIENLKQVYGEQHLMTANSYSSLAAIYLQESDFDKSEEYARKSFELRKSILGKNHPGMMNTQSFLGALLQRQGKYEDAVRHYGEAVRLFIENSLTDSLSYSSVMNNFAVTKSSLGRFDEAITLHRDALRIRELLLPAHHPSITVSMYNLADVYYQMHEFEQARNLFEKVVVRDKQAYGDDHPEVAIDLVKLASVVRDMHDFDYAEKLFTEAEFIFNDKFPPNHHRVGEFLMEFGRLKLLKDKREMAADLFNSSLEVFMENYNEDHERVLTVREYLAEFSEDNR